jgi:hypothetical protein
MLEPELADTVKAAIAELTGGTDGSPRGGDLRRLLVSMTPEYGELGPVLVRPRGHFTTAHELPTDYQKLWGDRGSPLHGGRECNARLGRR